MNDCERLCARVGGRGLLDVALPRVDVDSLDSMLPSIVGAETEIETVGNVALRGGLASGRGG